MVKTGARGKADDAPVAVHALTGVEGGVPAAAGSGSAVDGSACPTNLTRKGEPVAGGVVEESKTRGRAGGVDGGN